MLSSAREYWGLAASCLRAVSAVMLVCLLAGQFQNRGATGKALEPFRCWVGSRVAFSSCEI